MINYGVIVGRFQVNSLHPGHLDLFRRVSEKHDRVIVFVGVPRTAPTTRNPMDFETRKKMIQAEYPDFIIMPLQDQKSDEFWSHKLDEAISNVTHLTSHVTLYGGRDSFKPHYFGIYDVHELEIQSPISGTQIREKISNRVMQSPDFRAGVIYAATNRFPQTFMTIDVAICQRQSDHDPIVKVLLGRKPGERYFRFIGGFVEPGHNLEETVRKEAYEETKLDVYSIEYLASFSVDDWRYRKDPDAKITTAFFIAWTPTARAVAGDDIEEVKWFNSNELPDAVEEAHMPLLAVLKAYFNRRVN